MSPTKPFAVLGLLLFAVSTFAAPQARIMRTIDSRQMTALKGGVHPLARPEFDQGALDPSQILHRVTMSFNRSTAQQQELDQLLKDQQDPTSAYYHQWLTSAQFASRFGMAQADLTKVQQWLAAQGFTIDEVANGGGYIAFSGSVGQINSAFHTEIHQYNVNGDIHFANATSPAVPTAMVTVVAGLRGLNDFRPRPRATLREVKPDLTSGASFNLFLTPDDFATIYDLNALYSAGIDGTGQTIAIMGQTTIDISDITTFRSVSGLAANSPTEFDVPNSNPTRSTADLGEADLDVEWSGAVARKATIVYVNSGNGAFDSLQYVINNKINGKLIPVISISYGVCEADEGDFLAADEGNLQQASSQGQTVVAPSGDNGAADCDYSSSGVTSATRGYAVDFPASSPYAVGVGGTTLTEGSSITPYWSSSNNSSNGSALQYIPEDAWNDTQAAGALAATGGGVSTLFTKPSWQTGTGVPNDGYRDVPDIAFAASPAHDGFITCSAGSCAVCFPGGAANTTERGNADGNCSSSSLPGYRKDTTSWTLSVVGGTSAGVPTFAGVVALINQKTNSSQGTLNQKLYQMAASTPYAFHDITIGDNIVPCTTGKTDCPSGTTSIGYSAGPGYDLATGLGSVDAYNLVMNWNATATPDFAVSALNSSLAVARASTTTIPLRIAPLNGFNGTIALSCASTISGVTCSVAPNSVSPGTNVNVTVTANSTISSIRPNRAPLAPYLEFSFGVMGLFMMSPIRRRPGTRQLTLIALVAVVLMIALASCGGGGGSQSSDNSNVTTPATGSITITATSGALSHTTQIPITVN